MELQRQRQGSRGHKLGNHRKLGMGNGVSPGPLEGTGPCQHLNFKCLASRSVRESISACFMFCFLCSALFYASQRVTWSGSLRTSV